jgi:hypothetical protein
MPSYAYDHVHLISANPEKAAEFYEKMFGAQRKWKQELNGRLTIALKLEGTRILIAQHTGSGTLPPSNTTGLDHWGLVTDDMAGAVTNLKANAVKFRTEPYELVPGTTIAFIWAPDDVLLELMEVKPRKPKSSP